jgi:hypothetical protein
MRLVTRGNMDGLACAVLISANEDIEEIVLTHPQEVTDDRIDITANDILANLPYHPNCNKWFDHHQHGATLAEAPRELDGAYGLAPSAAHLVFEYYGGSNRLIRFAEMVHETDRVDAARLTPEDVSNPQGWIRLAFTIDSRTGLGAFQEYFLHLVALLKDAPPIEEVLKDPQVKRRCDILDESNAIFLDALKEYSRLEGNVVVTDFRPLQNPPIGNRFLVYTLFPDANVSVRLHWGPEQRFVVLALGHSIFNRTCKTDVGELAARYGGGGHAGAASVPLIEEADFQIQQVIAELKARG